MEPCGGRRGEPWLRCHATAAGLASTCAQAGKQTSIPASRTSSSDQDDFIRAANGSVAALASMRWCNAPTQLHVGEGSPAARLPWHKRACGICQSRQPGYRLGSPRLCLRYVVWLREGDIRLPRGNPSPAGGAHPSLAQRRGAPRNRPTPSCRVLSCKTIGRRRGGGHHPGNV